MAEVQEKAVRICVIALVFLLLGCDSRLEPQQIVGRWAEDKESRRYEFTPHRLYSVVENGKFVQSGTWELKEKTLSLRSLTSTAQESWLIESHNEKSFTVPSGEARFRRFDRVPNNPETFDPRLVGLWRTDGQNPQIVEFTERSTLVGVFWRLDKVGGTPFPVGVQANISRAGSDKFFMDGFLGNARMKKGVLPHPYAFEGDRLHWGVGLKRPATVYRRVTHQDVVELPQPTATPPSFPK